MCTIHMYKQPTTGKTPPLQWLLLCPCAVTDGVIMHGGARSACNPGTARVSVALSTDHRGTTWTHIVRCNNSNNSNMATPAKPRAMHECTEARVITTVAKIMFPRCCCSCPHRAAQIGWGDYSMLVTMLPNIAACATTQHMSTTPTS
jgi:hypothetical protein